MPLPRSTGPLVPKVDRHFGRQDADVGRALDEDRIGRQQRVVLLDDRPELIEERFAFLQPAAGQIGGRAAGREVAVGQPRTAGLFEQVENLFALAKRVQERAERAQIEAVCAHAHEVAGDAVQLGDQHSQMPAALRHAVAHQLLDRQRPAEIHVHPGQVIHAVGVRNPLPRREILADLFRAAMQIADVRHNFGNDFAIGPQHEPQHAMRARMLRAHVDEHFVRADVELDDAGIFNGC